MYLLDTNVISEMRKIPKGKANPNVANWFKTTKPSQLYTSIVVMMELQRGMLLKKRKDTIQSKNLEIWLKMSVKYTFAQHILYITDEISDICADLHVPNPRPENDAWIASTAIAHELILVTRNVGDFQNMPVRLLNPFD